MRKSPAYSVFLLSLITIISSCARQAYELQTVCEVNDVYNYVVKWDIRPLPEGKVEIFSSGTPSYFDLRYPVAVEDVAKGRADMMIKGSLNRRYFLLKFGDHTETVVGVRAQRLGREVENFRDMGGFKNADHQSIKWGELYRSGNLDKIDPAHAKRIEKMGIKTLIDLRMTPEIDSISPETGIVNYFHFPVSTKKADPLPLIRSNKFKRGDAAIFMQDVNKEMILNSTESLRNMFEVLSKDDNYPVVICCRYGTIQTSIAIALILSALDVPEQTIIDDYLLNNKYFNMRKIAAIGKQLPLEAQDAITTMMISDENYLMAALDAVKRKYGSVNQYLKKELGVDEECRRQLKHILLE
ncbi:MAG: tyrosine-protein phosphatase [Bacteroidales bacterium]|nr:tyrosine-protein phosphatase [Bacteroidales bacterium]